MSYEDLKKDKKILDDISGNLEYYIDTKQLNHSYITNEKIKLWCGLFIKNYEKAFKREIENDREDIEFGNFEIIYRTEKNKNLIPFLENLFTIYKILIDKIWRRLLLPKDR